MTDVVGGLKVRLIRESIFQYITAALEDLGWFDPTIPAQNPVIFESKAQDQDQEIKFNTAALSDENDRESGWQLGDNNIENTWQMYLDIFAESDALGLHFVQDIAAVLRGKFVTLGYDKPSFEVFDYRQATPPVLFSCDIENIDVDKAHGFLKPWLQHWYSVAFDVVYPDGDVS